MAKVLDIFLAGGGCLPNMYICRCISKPIGRYATYLLKFFNLDIMYSIFISLNISSLLPIGVKCKEYENF